MSSYTDSISPNNNFFGTWLSQLLLLMLFGGLLSIAFLDHDKYYLAWFAYVPLLLAVQNATLAKTYVLGLIGGLISFVSGTYWIFDFIVISKGLGALPSFLLSFLVWLYSAQQTAIMLVVFKWLTQRGRLHEFLVFPIVVAVFTSTYPMLFAMRLGESQINFYTALQATEFVGVHGLDAIIALSNIIIFRVLLMCLNRSEKSGRTGQNGRWPWTISISIIVCWFIYGAFSFSQWEGKQSSWSTIKVGIVQPNEIPWLGQTVRYPAFSKAYPPEMAMTEHLADQGAEIIIWPEAQAKDYLNNSKIASAYQNNIATQGVSLLFQDTQKIRHRNDGTLLAQYNTAVILNKKGQQTGSYQKLKRIPFGEYLPLIGDDSALRKKAMGFLGEFLNEISKGKGHKVFSHSQLNIIPLICYETTFPSFVGSAVKETASRIDKTKGSILVALSNDGWFGSSHQPYQHINVSILRAVENRLPLVHVANNGPSIAVSPNGKITFTSDFQKAGGYLTDVAYSQTAQGSFYSKHPKLFDRLLYLSFLLMIFYTIWLVALIEKKR